MGKGGRHQGKVSRKKNHRAKTARQELTLRELTDLGEHFPMTDLHHEEVAATMQDDTHLPSYDRNLEDIVTRQRELIQQLQKQRKPLFRLGMAIGALLAAIGLIAGFLLAHYFWK